MDPALLFPERDLPFWEAIDGRVGGTLKRSARNRVLIDAVFRHQGVPLSTPACEWPKSMWSVLLDGLYEPLLLKWTKKWGRATRKVEEHRVWEGLRTLLANWQSSLSWLMNETTCPTCKGGRLQPKSLAAVALLAAPRLDA